jgi:copper homeostasis protein (lipoprotein)
VKLFLLQTPNKFIINFTEEGRLSSTTDCNNIGGSFIKNEEMISIGQLVSTLMACEGDILESKYAEQLSLASSYTIKDNVLTINLVKDAGKMTFIKQ